MRLTQPTLLYSIITCSHDSELGVGIKYDLGSPIKRQSQEKNDPMSIAFFIGFFLTIIRQRFFATSDISRVLCRLLPHQSTIRV